MDVRMQIGMVFHLDKCIGCHTWFDRLPKNIWTDRRGTEYMWWNNVETKPGTGYPTKWEDQQKYSGGWENNGHGLRLKSTGKAASSPTSFTTRTCRPWTTTTSRGPTTTRTCSTHPKVPTSLRHCRSPWMTGKYIDVEAGPNWTTTSRFARHAANDQPEPASPPSRRPSSRGWSNWVFFYSRAICNHCLIRRAWPRARPEALYKRGEDGNRLIDQKRCRGVACLRCAGSLQEILLQLAPGKSEKCILCFRALGNRAGAGVLPLVRRTHPLSGRAAVRRLPHRGGGQAAR